VRELAKAALFILAVYGLSNAIAVLKIGQYFFGIGYCRERDCPSGKHPKDKRRFLGRIPYLGDLFYCPPCLAFWIGMAGSVYIFSPAAEFVGVWWKAMIVDGLAACGAVYLAHVGAELMGYKLDL
jgi:hypothetical protein